MSRFGKLKTLFVYLLPILSSVICGYYTLVILISSVDYWPLILITISSLHLLSFVPLYVSGIRNRLTKRLIFFSCYWAISLLLLVLGLIFEGGGLFFLNSELIFTILNILFSFPVIGFGAVFDSTLPSIGLVGILLIFGIYGIIWIKKQQKYGLSF